MTLTLIIALSWDCHAGTSERNDRDEQLLEHGVLRRHAKVRVMSDYANGVDRVNEDLQRTANRCEATISTPAHWMEALRLIVMPVFSCCTLRVDRSRLRPHQQSPRSHAPA